MNVTFEIKNREIPTPPTGIFERMTIFQTKRDGEDATYILEIYDETDREFARTIIYALAALSLVSEYIYARSTYKVDLLTKQEEIKNLLRDYYEVDTHEELLALLKPGIEKDAAARKNTPAVALEK